MLITQRKITINPFRFYIFLYQQLVIVTRMKEFMTSVALLISLAVFVNSVRACFAHGWYGGRSSGEDRRNDQNDYSSNVSYYYKALHIAGFQFLDLYSTYQILSSSIMTSSLVWNQILLLCPFHQVLVS